MKELVRALKPSQFSDISALVALYRPGPMKSGMHEEFVARKHGRKKITYEHSSLEPILKETYGTMIYQEQVMNISKAMAGFTPAQADDLRKAMGKKIAEKMEKAKNDFLTGCEKNKIPSKTAGKIFGQMAEFAAYGFNKSHSVAYALVSYQTAYLKANYPVEFMTSALTSEIGHNAIGSEDKENKIVTYKNEALEMGIAVLGPDIQRSEIDFSAESVEEGKKTIRFGLQAVKNVGCEAAKSIIAARESGGPFKNLDDLCMRVDLRQANKKTFESLVKAGALDCLLPQLPPEKSRAELLAALEKTLLRMGKVKEEMASQQESLFGGGLEM
ncbi:MAG TPA: DNA polymerase III subunit alpha, partial [Elusimicrobiales bacterium]|nr:DNA polymerase III subunit alpha [Elusimicrobiales bacterium]